MTAQPKAPRPSPPLAWFHAPGYDYGRGLPLPKKIHGFIRNKPSRIRDALIDAGVARASEFIAPPPVSLAELRAVHEDAVITGLSSAAYVANAAELPILAHAPLAVVRHAIVKPQLLAAGGTIAAARHASAGGWAFNLSGGYHHARPDLVHGFCLVGDVPLAIHALHQDGIRPRTLILDLDLHQGDGNAAAFATTDGVVTASMHQDSAFPHPKLRSDIDVPLPDGIDDSAYLDALSALLARIVADAPAFELIVYVAGTDPFEDDVIGALSLTRAGLVERDRRVALCARQLGAGLVVVPAGGYSDASPDIAAAGFIAMVNAR